MTRRFQGAVALPRSILVAEDALGQTFNGRVEIGAFSITLPRLPDDRDGASQLQSPTPYSDHQSDAIDRGTPWGYMGFAKTAGKPRPLASNVSRFAITIDFHSGQEIDYANLADQFRREFNHWYSTAAQWLELRTEQVINPDENTSIETNGSIWEVNTDPPNLTGWLPPMGEIFFQLSNKAADRLTLRDSFARATKNEEPPLEWLIYLRSLRWKDMRLRVIEAATAAEVALARGIDRRLSHLSEKERKQAIKDAGGLAGLVILIEEIDGVTRKSKAGRVMHRLASPRNLAVHTAEIPSPETVTHALTTTKSILDEYSPLSALTK